MRSSTEKETKLEAADDDAGPFNLKHLLLARLSSCFPCSAWGVNLGNGARMAVDIGRIGPVFGDTDKPCVPMRG